MKQKILITGATGFVGKHLVPQLLKEGYQILEITRDIIKSEKLFKDATLKLLVNDINFKEKIVDFEPEIVIHLASYLTSSDDWQHIENLVNTNILFLSKVLDAVSSSNLELFINTGSFSEYNKGDDVFIPAYYYSATKTASRALVEYYANINKFKQVTVVPYTIYGGNDSQKKIIDILYESTLQIGSIDLSPGGQILDFIHIDDVADFYLAVVKNIKMLPNKINFKLGTGIGHSLKEVAVYIEEITNRRTNINWGGISYRNSDVMYAVADLLSVKEILDWAPKIDLKSGIMKMIQVKEKKS
jgi:nucleoside-diphosphate-sugar epimerase